MQDVNTRVAPDGTVAPWRAALSGACASLVGIGLARFAYTPLLPAIIGAGWFTAADAAYLGAANLAGYLAGALLARRLAARIPPVPALRAMMLVASVAFFGCAAPLSFPWFFAWRLMSGIAGGVLMVLAATTVLPHVPPARRGLASGAIFAGIGFGVIASGTLVPLLLRHGPAVAWLGLGTVALGLTALAWGGWPGGRPAAAAASLARRADRAAPAGRQLRALYAEYALNAVGLVPHMIFLVDYVARGLRQGLDAGARYWVLFGVGAVLGPLLTGRLADRTGYRTALRLAFPIQAAAVALPALGAGTAGLIVSSVVVGAFTPGIVLLVLGRVHELLPHDALSRTAAWGAATASYALLQAATAYAFSFLLARTGDYRLLFGLSAGALLAALALDLAAASGRRHGRA